MKHHEARIESLEKQYLELHGEDSIKPGVIKSYYPNHQSEIKEHELKSSDYIDKQYEKLAVHFQKVVGALKSEMNSAVVGVNKKIKRLAAQSSADPQQKTTVGEEFTVAKGKSNIAIEKYDQAVRDLEQRQRAGEAGNESRRVLRCLSAQQLMKMQPEIPKKPSGPSSSEGMKVS